MQNLRVLKRISLVCALEVTDGERRTLLGVLKDVTSEGMRVRGPGHFQPDDRFVLQLALPTAAGDTIVNIEARCRWVMDADVPGLREAGFRFVDPSPDVTAALEELIQRFRR